MTDYLPPVVARLTGDDNSLTRTLAASKDKVRRWAAEVGRTRATITVDAKLRDGTLADLRRRIDTGPAARLKVELQLAAGQRAELQRSLTDRELQVKVKPVMDTAAQRRVETVLRELGRPITVQVRPRVDVASQRAAEVRLERVSRDRTVNIRARVTGLGSISGGGSGGSGGLRDLVSLAPAVVPVVASLAASAAGIAAAMGAAALATSAYGLAVASQISRIGDAADAQSKYNEAVAEYGKHSAQALKAQQTYTRTLDAMPLATRRAALAFTTLQEDFKDWSDSLSAFTMDPVEHSFAVFDALLPRFSPMVRGASKDLDRLITIAGGAMSTPGFDAYAQRVTDFADRVMDHAIDDVIHFTRVLSEGNASGPVAEFLRYARQQGPLVRQTLTDIGRAAETILKGASEAGPGLLTLVDAAAKLVAALPAGFVGRAMQVYAALKLVGLTNRGITAAAASVGSLTTRLGTLHTTAVAAGGGVTGVRAAVASLSTGTKVTGALAVIGGLAYAAYKLADNNEAARVSVDDLARSIQTGLSRGRVASPVLDELRQGMAGVLKETDASATAWDKIGYSFTHWGGKWSDSASSAKAVANAQRDLGKALGEVAQNQGVDTATRALKLLNEQGAKIPTKYLKEYTNALADQAFADKMAANSMGMFGAQALDVQKKLDAQKRAAQGLQQAILDLNDANRAALDAEADYQQAIDDGTKGIKNHEKSLRMVNGALDLNSESARESYERLSKLAAATQASATATLEQTGSQEKANRRLIEGHDRLVALAEKFGLGTKDAQKFADTLDNIKDPKIQVTVDTMKAEANLAAAKKKVDSFPKRARTDANFEYQKALRDLLYYRRQVDLLNGRHSTVTVTTLLITENRTINTGKGGRGPNAADGALITGRVRRMADGGFGRPAMMARGGSNILWGEGPDESYIPHDRRPRSRRIAEETVGIMGGSVSWGGAAGGGASPAGAAAPLGAQVARGLWQGMDGQAAWLASQARAFATRTIPGPMAEALGIKSPSRVAAALGRWVGHGLVQGLTGSTASVKSATLRLSRAIEQVFHDDAQRQLAADQKRLAALAGVKGSKAAHQRADLRKDIRQQQRLLDSGIARFVEVDNQRLLKLAAQRDTVAGKLKAAQSKLADLRRNWADQRNQVASGILQNASVITSAPQPGVALTAQDVVNNLKDQAAKAAAFAAQLQELKKKGLGSDLIAQIAQAGVDQGGATAAALAGAGKGTIDQLNTIQKGLNTSAKTAGTTVADAMYGAGIKSAEGLVKGLKSQQKAIEDQMLAIAKAMQAAIRKALGIHSPSRVMAVDGEYTGRGFALGLERSTKHVQIAARGMAMAARQGATLTGGGAAAPAPGQPVVHVQVTVQGSVVTERNLTEAVRTALLKDGLRNPTVGLTPRR